MRIEGRKIDFLQALYKRWKDANADRYEQFDRAKEQYDGSQKSDEGEDTAVVENITYELIESEVSVDNPGVKVTPRIYSQRNERNAKSVERMIGLEMDRLPVEQLNDEDERNTYLFGGSVWIAEWDDSVVHGKEVGAPVITVLPPNHLVWDPNRSRIDDCDAVFVRFDSSKSECVRRFGVKFDALDNGRISTGDEETGEAIDGAQPTVDDEYMEYIVCWYRDDNGNVCKFVWSGDVVLEDIDDYYGRKRKYCTKCGRREQVCTCEHPQIELVTDEFEELDDDVRLNHVRDVMDPATGATVEVAETIPAESPVIKDDGTPEMVREESPVVDPVSGTYALDDSGNVMTEIVETPKMEKTRIPYYKPNMFPVRVRKNIDVQRSIIGRSDALTIRVQQQEVNKLATRIQQKLLRSGVTPVLPEDAGVTLDNSVFGRTIRLMPGENKGQYGVLDTTPDISADVAEIMRIEDRAKRILGITDSYQGQADNTAKSGVAKQAQIAQAAGRLQSKRVLKGACRADLAQVIFQLYLAYADEPRQISYVDEFGVRQNVAFNRYDFLVRDDLTGEYYYDDEYCFAADDTANVEQQRDAMWQANRDNLVSGAFGDPASPVTLHRYWLMQERAHYPGASDNVAYFKDMANKVQEAQANPAQIPTGGVTNGAE